MKAQLFTSFKPFLQWIWSTLGAHETWQLLSDGNEDSSNMMSLTKIVQHRSNFQPYINDKISNLGEQVKIKFNNAITTKHDYDLDDCDKCKSL